MGLGGDGTERRGLQWEGFDRNCGGAGDSVGAFVSNVAGCTGNYENTMPQGTPTGSNSHSNRVTTQQCQRLIIRFKNPWT
jgi:hypothetical protein